jgi:putative FmdB family regulatory protein
MPTYQYRCTECGHDLEAVQKFTDAALTECPDCGGSLRKIFNAVGVVFKGSGFYRTDSRGAEKKAGTDGAADAPKKEKADAGAAAGGTGGTSTKNGESGAKSESKPAKQPATSTSSTAGKA